MPVAIAALQMGQPIDTKVRRLVAGLGRPDRNVGLIGQIFTGAVVAVIVDEQEMIDAQIAVVLQEERQADPFVADGGQKQNRLWNDLRGAVHDS